MARKKKSDTDEESNGNAGHNVADIKALIRECSAEFLDIAEARKELNEQAGEMRKRLRDAGVDTNAFEYGVKVAQMDPDAKGNYLDWVRVTFETLDVGGQGALFVEEPASPVGDEQKRKARQAGHDAGFEGQPSTVNPHESKSPLRSEWHNGWLAQQAEAVAKLDPKNKPEYLAEQEAAETA